MRRGGALLERERKMNRKCTFTVASLGIALFFGSLPTSASAGFVDLGTSGWRASWDPSLDGTVQIVVDGQSANAVFIQKSIQFIGPPGPGGFAPVNITF